jgi:hypothetical protein
MNLKKIGCHVWGCFHSWCRVSYVIQTQAHVQGRSKSFDSNQEKKNTKVPYSETIKMLGQGWSLTFQDLGYDYVLSGQGHPQLGRGLYGPNIFLILPRLSRRPFRPTKPVSQVTFKCIIRLVPNSHLFLYQGEWSQIYLVYPDYRAVKICFF